MAMSAKASDDIAWLPATAQLAVLAAKKVSSAELVELYLSRIDTYNASLNAIVTVDPDAARRVAKRSDAARARGDELGPLHGLPITVKDSYETAGMRTTCGRRDLADYVPTQDAEAVARLRRAGAIIMGTVPKPDMANVKRSDHGSSWAGATRHPAAWAPVCRRRSQTATTRPGSPTANALAR